MERLIATEEREERVLERQSVKVSISKGHLVVTIALPADKLFGATERIESAKGMANKLRAIAKELES